MEDGDVEPAMFKSVGIFRGLEYLESLQKPDGRTPVILEWLAEDLHKYNEVIAKRLGKMKNFRQIIMSILRLMIKGDKRYSLNATYIMAMLSETDLIMEEILTIKENDFASGACLEDVSQPRSLLALIGCVIHNGDEQSVLNALALLGNMLKNKAGVKWLLTNSTLCLNDVLDDVISMVSDKSPTGRSNAELIIARICSLEKGRNLVYCHPFFDQLISHLIFSLESLEKKVVQNAAYALTELCHSHLICKVVISTQWATNMAEMLLRLLTSDHIPIRIHSCKALRSLASSDEGFMFLNEIQDAENMLLSLINMLDGSAENTEIGIAAVRFLITFAEHQDGRLRIRQSQNICMLLKHYELNFTNIPDTLKKEIGLLNQLLEFLGQPNPPTLTVQGSRSILVNCIYQQHTIYELWKGTTVVHSGQEDAYLVEGLEPYTEYSFRLRLLHGCDKSPFSAVVMARTLEGEPEQCVHVSANPISCHQIKLSWDTPHCINGLLTEYRIYRNDCMIMATVKTYVTVSGLQPQQRYKFEISCVNGSHEGPRVVVNSKTFPETYNATSKPSVVVLSDQEVFVTWQKPLHLSGQLIRYELNVNGKVMYSGIDTNYTVKTLTADKTYEFKVAVVSTEVIATSEVVSRRTPKAQSNSTKLSSLPRNKNDLLHSNLQDLQNKSVVYDDDLKDSKSDLCFSDSNRESPDHVSGEIMQNLIEQYSNDCSKSTLPNSAVHGIQIHDQLLPEPRTSLLCDQKPTRPSHQKSSLIPINILCAQTEKMLSEPLSSLSRNSNLRNKKTNPTTLSDI